MMISVATTPRPSNGAATEDRRCLKLERWNIGVEKPSGSVDGRWRTSSGNAPC